ncbi:MAG: hypothetical protein K0Q79_492 [Flavipsychrobacter sp.]|jgi:hypothetical protein|nr:hypothetical protein [Flavipsychrobacter sp.]
MKNSKLIVFSAFVMALFTGFIIFSSCSRTNCDKIICQNGGTCADGKCTCLAGFTGALCQSRANSAIQYINNAFTPITISVNGDTRIIPVGGSVAYGGQYGLAATGTATTAGNGAMLGVTTDGGKVGLTINWPIDNIFPATDTLRVPMDVGATWFFLRIANVSSRNIINYYVNYQFSYGEEYQDVTIPNNGTTYGMGYYLAYPYSNVQTQSTSSTTPKIDWRAVTLPFTSNQSATVTIN